MKKTLLLLALLSVTALSSFAQSITYPYVEHSDDRSSKIAKIETGKKYTIVSFEQVSSGEGAWVQLNKEIFIQTNLSNKHYNYVKSENIAIVPEKHHFAKRGDTLLFKVYFERIPPETKRIDIIERAGYRTDGITFFNFYNVSLSQSTPKTLSVRLTPPLPQRSLDISKHATGGESAMMGAMNSMVPMFGTMTRSIIDAQIEYYKQPGKLAEIAKLNKQYFDSLVKEGFTEEQALKIITSNSLLPKSAGIK